MKEGGVKLAPTVDMDKHTNTTNHTGLSILFTSLPAPLHQRISEKIRTYLSELPAPDLPTKQKRPTCLNLTDWQTFDVLIERQDYLHSMQEGSSAT